MCTVALYTRPVSTLVSIYQYYYVFIVLLASSVSQCAWYEGVCSAVVPMVITLNAGLFLEIFHLEKKKNPTMDSMRISSSYELQTVKKSNIKKVKWGRTN